MTKIVKLLVEKDCVCCGATIFLSDGDDWYWENSICSSICDDKINGYI